MPEVITPVSGKGRTEPLTKAQCEELIQYAGTTRQIEFLKAVAKHGSNQKAAEALGVGRKTVDISVQRVLARGARHGWTANEYILGGESPPGMHVKGVSTLVDEEGKKKIQWIKLDADRQKQHELLIEAIQETASTLPIVNRIPAPTKKLSKDVLTVYPMGDPHIGMYAWEDETGADFDLEIATKNLVEATTRLVASAPGSEQALICNVGDFFHADNPSNRTNRSGHQLDVDTRWQKVFRAGFVLMRSCIEAALLKHKRVHVINEIGNHDETTAFVLTECLMAEYRKNPRVTFDDSPSRFHYYRFGKVLLGVNHGDMVKADRLPGIMATDMAQDWGETEFRYWYTGHIHTNKKFEAPGCVMESFRTLAGKDSWTAASGYRSGRDMYAIALHKDFGEFERHRIDVKML